MIVELKDAEIALVAAPRCKACRQRMKGHDLSQWACVNPACSRANTPVFIQGVFPFRKLAGLPGR